MDCLTPEKIEGYIKRQLSNDVQIAVEQHVNQCRQCSEKLNEAMENESLLSQIHTHQMSIMTQSFGPSQMSQPSMTTPQAQEIVGAQYTIVKKIGQESSRPWIRRLTDSLQSNFSVRKPIQKQAGLTSGARGNL